MKLRFVIGEEQHGALFFFLFPDWRRKGPPELPLPPDFSQ
jgi:hypothetical protein